MNVANLQLEGLLIAVASLNRLLVEKGLVSAADVDHALRKAETSIRNDERTSQDIPPANRDAMCFPIRLLLLANSAQESANLPSFSELAKQVGQTKDKNG
jgi:hypothetical protein